MNETGRVIQIKGDLAIVSMTRNETCGHCNACEKGNPHLVEALNHCNAGVNDRASIELQGNTFIKAAIILYGIPLLMFIFGILTGCFLFWVLKIEASVELPSFALGIVFALSSCFIIKK